MTEEFGPFNVSSLGNFTSPFEKCQIVSLPVYWLDYLAFGDYLLHSLHCLNTYPHQTYTHRRFPPILQAASLFCCVLLLSCRFFFHEPHPHPHQLLLPSFDIWNLSFPNSTTRWESGIQYMRCWTAFLIQTTAHGLERGYWRPAFHCWAFSSRWILGKDARLHLCAQQWGPQTEVDRSRPIVTQMTLVKISGHKTKRKDERDSIWERDFR